MNAEAQAQNQAQEIKTFLLPIVNRYLMVPTSCIAEIIHARVPATKTAAPEWFLGCIDWRGKPVPLVCFEVLNGGEYQASEQRLNMAIVHSHTGGSQGLPVFAILAQAPPRLLNVLKSEIVQDAQATGRAVKMPVRVGDQAALIPDLEFLETVLLGHRALWAGEVSSAESLLES